MESYLVEILFGSFALLLILGAPISVALGGSAMAAYLVLDKDPIACSSARSLARALQQRRPWAC